MRIFATSRPTGRATAEGLAATMDEEVAVGRALYRDGIIVQAYMDPDYSRTFMILEARNVDEARRAFDRYPQVREGLIVFEFSPLIGMPAIADVHRADGSALPAWWPGDQL